MNKVEETANRQITPSAALLEPLQYVPSVSPVLATPAVAIASAFMAAAFGAGVASDLVEQGGYAPVSGDGLDATGFTAGQLIQARMGRLV